MLRHRLGCDLATCPYARAYHAAMRRAEAAEQARPPVDESILRRHQGVTRLLELCDSLDREAARFRAWCPALSGAYHGDRVHTATIRRLLAEQEVDA
jgi:hypothetical protein